MNLAICSDLLQGRAFRLLTFLFLSFFAIWPAFDTYSGYQDHFDVVLDETFDPDDDEYHVADTSERQIHAHSPFDRGHPEHPPVPGSPCTHVTRSYIPTNAIPSCQS